MCRFIAYIGNPILLHDIIVKPTNSLVKQSIQARESDHPINADGFGLGWYDHSIDNVPGIFRSYQPAWNDLNLVNLTSKVKSKCFFAHIRAASQGGVALDNCHPFAFQELMFMHNGNIQNFRAIKRQLRRQLDDDVYEWLKGQTDSEHFFALFIQTMRDNQLSSQSLELFYQTLILTIERINFLMKTAKMDSLVFLNIAITDGHRVIVSRYVSNPELCARTLYYAVGDQFIFEHGAGHMYPVTKKPGAVLISSEKLTDYNLEWHMVAQNHCILIDEDLTTTIKAMEIA